MDVSIHRIKKGDLKDVLEIENLSFNDPWTEEMFEDEIKDGNFYVVKDGQKIIGYGGFTFVLDEASLVNLAISLNYRRCGIGTKLLKHIIKMAKEKDGKSIFLEVRRSNIAAISFYHKNGFIEIGIRKGYYENEEDAIIMERNL